MFQPGDTKALVLSLWFQVLGETAVPNVSTRHFFGVVRDDPNSLEVSFFGQ